MRKTVVTAMLAGALLTGGVVGSALFGAGAATAQSSSSDSTSSSSSAPGQSDAPPDLPGDPGPRGPHGRHGPGFGHHADLGVAANAIGITEDELRSALQSGQSIADVAKAHNVDPQTVIDALVADAKSHLADEVTNGHLTQAQADQISADLEQRIADFVNRTGPPPGRGGCPGMGPEAPDRSGGSNGSSSSDSGSSDSSSSSASASGTSFDA